MLAAGSRAPGPKVNALGFGVVRRIKLETDQSTELERVIQRPLFGGSLFDTRWRVASRKEFFWACGKRLSPAVLM